MYSGNRGGGLILFIVSLSLAALALARLERRQIQNPNYTTWVKHVGSTGLLESVFGDASTGKPSITGIVSDPAILAHDLKYHMYFSQQDSKSIGVTVSRDGFSWQAHKELFKGEEWWSLVVSKPFVMHHQHKFMMWYTGVYEIYMPEPISVLGFASSGDGVQWDRLPEPILQPELPWEGTAVMCSSIIYEHEKMTFRMWYSGGNSNKPTAFGHAISVDGTNWTRTQDKPIFEIDVRYHFEQELISCPQVIHDGGDYYLMFYSSKKETGAIGLARSRDGIHDWQRHQYNPIIAATPFTYDHYGACKPFAHFNGTHWLLWYSGTNEIGLATHVGHDFQFEEVENHIVKVEFNASAHMRDVTADWPSVWRQNVVFAVVMDEHYVNAMQLFVESLLFTGYTMDDILLICSSTECRKRLEKLDVPHLLIEDARCYNTRCAIGNAKALTIIGVLESNATVFFFDLDVYFKRDPLLDLKLNASDVLVVQDNRDPVSPHNGLNYGMFIVRPHSTTRKLFRYIAEESFKGVWDQESFNVGAALFNISFSLLDQEEYVLHDHERWHNVNHLTMKAVHMICVEGSLNKLHIGRFAYDSFLHPSYYRAKKTIAMNYECTVEPPPYEKQALVSIGHMAKNIALATGRSFRYKNWPKAAAMISLYNADTLAEVGVDLVETSFWDYGVKYYRPGYEHTTRTIEIRTYKDLMFLQNALENEWKDVDEVMIDYMNETLYENPNYNAEDILKREGVNVTGYLSPPEIAWSVQEYVGRTRVTQYDLFLCPVFNTRFPQCLRSCTGGHF